MCRFFSVQFVYLSEQANNEKTKNWKKNVKQQTCWKLKNKLKLNTWTKQQKTQKVEFKSAKSSDVEFLCGNSLLFHISLKTIEFHSLISHLIIIFIDFVVKVTFIDKLLLKVESNANVLCKQASNPFFGSF